MVIDERVYRQIEDQTLGWEIKRARLLDSKGGYTTFLTVQGSE